MRPPRWLAVAGVAALAFLGACSESDMELGTGTPDAPTIDAAADPLNALARAAERSSEATSLRVSFQLSMTGLPDIGAADMTGSGAFDQRSNSFEMSFDFGELGQSLPGAQEFTMDIVSDGAYVYIASPLFEPMLAGGANWFRVDAEAAGFSTDDLTPAPGAGDPSQLLTVLGGSENIEVLGTERIDGVEATHLGGSLDPQAVDVDALPASGRESARETLAALGDVEIPIEVWIGEDGLVRRMRMTYDLAALDPSGLTPAGATGVLQMDMTDYGEPVVVDTPTDWQDGTDIFAGGGPGAFGN